MSQSIQEPKIVIQEMLSKNSEMFKALCSKTFENIEPDEMLQELKKSLHIIQKEVANKAKVSWAQDSDPEQAAKDRHDLYGNLTKINFGISFLTMVHSGEFSESEIFSLKDIIANNKKIYQSLKDIFTQTKK